MRELAITQTARMKGNIFLGKTANKTKDVYQRYVLCVLRTFLYFSQISEPVQNPTDGREQKQSLRGFLLLSWENDGSGLQARRYGPEEALPAFVPGNF